MFPHVSCDYPFFEFCMYLYICLLSSGFRLKLSSSLRAGCFGLGTAASAIQAWSLRADSLINLETRFHKDKNSCTPPLGYFSFTHCSVNWLSKCDIVDRCNVSQWYFLFEMCGCCVSNFVSWFFAVLCFSWPVLFCLLVFMLWFSMLFSYQVSNPKKNKLSWVKPSHLPTSTSPGPPTAPGHIVPAARASRASAARQPRQSRRAPRAVHAHREATVQIHGLRTREPPGGREPPGASQAKQNRANMMKTYMKTYENHGETTEKMVWKDESPEVLQVECGAFIKFNWC